MSVLFPRVGPGLSDEIPLNEQYRLGKDPTLYNVAAARFLGDGGLIVANAGSAEVFWFDQGGSLERTSGRRGDGPGEYQRITAVFGRADGGVSVYDAGPGRMTDLDSTGAVAGTSSLSSGSPALDLVPLAMLPDGGSLSVYGEMRVFGGSGASRDSTPLIHIHADTEARDTLGYWKGKEWYYVPLERGIARLAVGFSRDVVYAGRNGRVVVGTTDSLNLSVVDGTGRVVMRLMGPSGRTPIPGALVEEWRADLGERMKNAPPQIKGVLQEIPVNETYPDLQGVGISDSGQVWIGLRTAADARSDEWLVVSPDGEVLGSVSLPKSARILDVAGERVAVLYRDELDEEFISVYQIGG